MGAWHGCQAPLPIRGPLLSLILGWVCLWPVIGQAESAQNYVDYGASLVVAGKHQEALTFLKYAVQLEPKLPKAWELLGKAYQGLGDSKLAKKYLDYAATLQGQQAPAQEQGIEHSLEPPEGKVSGGVSSRVSLDRLDSLLEQGDYSAALTLLQQASGASGFSGADKRRIALTKYEISQKLLRDARDTAVRYPDLHASDRELRNLAKYGMPRPSRAMAKFAISWVAFSPVIHGFDLGFSPLPTLNVGFSYGIIPSSVVKYRAIEPRLKIYTSADNYSFMAGIGFLSGSSTEVDRIISWTAFNVKLGMARQKGHFLIEMDWSIGMLSIGDEIDRFFVPVAIPGLRIGLVF